MRRFKAACGTDPALREVLDDMTGAYRRRRALVATAEDPRPEAGIGGPEGPDEASCLHAYAAALLAALAGWLDEDAPADLSGAAARAWDRFFPPRESLWCADDRCSAGVPECDRAATAGSPAARIDRRVAAIDVGTISVRLLVADMQSGRLQQVLRRVEVTRLGEGLRAGETLGEEPARRTGAVVARYAEEARGQGAGLIVIAGTSATRDAADGEEFIRGLGADNRAEAVVLSGAEEAALAYSGASLDVEGEFVVLDIGGGSTELIRRAPGGGVEAVSLELGASRATERWIRSDPPSEKELTEVREEAVALFRTHRARFGPSAGRLVGVAGTVTTLACLAADLQTYDAQAIHLRKLALPVVDELVARLAAMTTTERSALPCVQAGRAPVIVGGAVIVKAAMQTLRYRELTVSERDLLDGLALAALSGRFPPA